VKEKLPLGSIAARFLSRPAPKPPAPIAAFSIEPSGQVSVTQVLNAATCPWLTMKRPAKPCEVAIE
jgi:hypothetical protein